MSKLPSVSGKQLCKALEKDGFVLIRQTASHRIYQKQTEEGTITIPVPVHANKPLKRGTLHNILKKAGISKEKLKFLLTLLFS
ncbi:type II toxin-antitoxin system HicA family toxin [Thermodesulfovibrio sp. 3907-1M]|uniref:Type II toxin-antitoxin system HicA family toxin n=1 Tax=Thermodesulfovibrio autotrophicus TaxID=3118333 RepID=A0AAU8GY93_9BACT